jgi:ABC-type branched-subunit amino acid transport system substrate-binding protein
LPATRPWRVALLIVAVLAALSFIAIEPPAEQAHDAGLESLGTGRGDTESVANVGAADGGTGSGEGGIGGTGTGASSAGTGASTGGAGRTGTASGTQSGGASKSAAALECKAGRNGGKTAPGVSGNRIKLAATNVRSGTGASFLGTAYIGMQAVVNRVNAAGGICGRLLDLKLVDDGWSAPRGGLYIATFAKEDYFALPVVPSSEGLTQAIINHTIDDAAIPVVGSDGMLKEQYSSPWVWPVATSTVATMRIMTKYAFDNGARTFGIVYDNKYRFGVEGHDAFVEYVSELTGAKPKADVPLLPEQSKYSGEANSFNEQCGPQGCDFVAMLLTPETANTYINSQPQLADTGRRRGFGRIMTGGAQPLFNERFARDCKAACDGMLVWTGYNPPIGGLSSEKDVAAYVDDVRSVDPQVDVNNQFLQGSYIGMKVFVAALEKVGPDLTRANLKAALDSITFESGLSSPLSWKSSRFANNAAQPFRVATAGGDFLGFAEVGTGFLQDPHPGRVPG